MGRDSCSLCGQKAITLQVCPSVGPLQDAAHSYPGASEVAGGGGRVTVGRGGPQPDPDTPVGEGEQSEHRDSRAQGARLGTDP